MIHSIVKYCQPVLEQPAKTVAAFRTEDLH
jgi:hypothetical protein